MKLFSPAAERNQAVISEQIASILPSEGTVVEIASGSGQHVCYFAQRFPYLTFQPTDLTKQAIASIDSYQEELDLPNLLPALQLDVVKFWALEKAEALICSNMIHISPWSCTEALFRGAARILGSGAPLIVYGPFMIDGAPTTESNLQFHLSLQSRDPEWGIRDLAKVRKVAEAAGFSLRERLSMPANNFLLHFRKL